MNVKKEQIFNGRVVSLSLEDHTLPDGRSATFEIVRHPGGAAILPVLADGRLVLIRQFRPAPGGMVLEIPAGKLDHAEEPEECARRELLEEVGYHAGRITKLGEMLTAVGFCDERLHLYTAHDLTLQQTALEPDEFIEPVIVSLEEALELIRQGEIPDGKTQLSLLLYKDSLSETSA